MKHFLSLMVLSISTFAFSSCPEMAQKAVSKYKKSNPVTSTSYALFSKALKHYNAEIALDSEVKPYLESTAAYFKKGKLSGFEGIMTMGGDEDTLRYVLNEKKEIIVAYWYNQSPTTFWFCGTGKVISEEYTEDGDEI
jgi:hypothetical protein